MSEEAERLQELVLRARSGDVEAFGSLYRSHQAGIYTFILSQVRERELAADLTQEAFVRAWQSLRRLRSPDAFRGWLHRIAGNLVRDEVKSGRARLEVTEATLTADEEGFGLDFSPAEGDGPEEAAVSAELKQHISRALAELSPEHRAAVVMHHVEGMSVEEIAEAAGVRPGTVMSRLARARAVLRERLGPYVEGHDG